MNAFLIDTNVLVYAHSKEDRSKHKRAIEILEKLSDGRGRFSIQTLAEFGSLCTRGRKALMSAEAATAQIEAIVGRWTIYDFTPAVVREALHGVRHHKMNYWDAQIWAVARLHNVGTVLSEDFAEGAAIEGVRFVNPFAAGFDLAARG